MSPLRLQFLGPPRVEGSDTLLTGHRIALLALLALAPKGLLPRDRLLGMLWPESTMGNARHSLNQAVHTIRKDLGDDVLLSERENLRLDLSRVTVDVLQFEAALRDGAAQTAVALYTAPFLDGLILPGALEFEQWTERERDRLERLYCDAIEQLARTAALHGRSGEAIRWWRERVAHSPADARVVLQLMRALADAGDRAAALQAATAHTRLLREEFDAVADSHIERFARELRHISTQLPLPAGPSVPLPIREAAAELPAEPRAASIKPAQSMPWRPRVRIALSALFALMIAGGWWVAQRDSATALPDAAGPIAVFPFCASGHAAPDAGADIAHLLAISLDGTGSLRTTDPATVVTAARKSSLQCRDAEHAAKTAAQLESPRFLLGSLVQAEHQVRVDVTSYATANARLEWAVTTTLPSANLLHAVDSLVRQIVLTAGIRIADRLSSVAATTTSSTAALRAYLDGDRLIREASNYDRARERFAEAVVLDSTFALAWLRLSMASTWSGKHADDAVALRQAIRWQARLPERDRQFLQAWAASRSDPAEGIEHAQQYLGSYPADAIAWRLLANLEIHYGRKLGHDGLAAAARAFDQAIKYGSGSDAMFMRAWIAWTDGDTITADSLSRAVLAVPDRGEWTLGLEAAQAFHRRDTARIRAVYQKVRSASDAIAIAAMDWAEWLGEPAAAETLAHIPTEPGRARSTRAIGELWRARIALQRGRLRDAQAAFDRLAALDSAAALEYRALTALTPPFGPGHAELQRLRQALKQQRARSGQPMPGVWSNLLHEEIHPQIRLYLLGRLSAALGEPDAAHDYADQLEQLTPHTKSPVLNRNLALAVRAHNAHHENRREQAIDLLSRIQPTSFALSNEIVQAWPERFLRAELLRESGQPLRALDWIGWQNVEAPLFSYGTIAELTVATLSAQLGQYDQARGIYERRLKFWADADPEFQPIVRATHQKLASLPR